MTESKRSDTKHGNVWRCPDHKRQKKPIRKGSFVENSHLTQEQFITLAFLWSHDATPKMAASLAGVSSRTVTDWFGFCRDVCTLKNRRDPQLLGGVGKIFEIDETVVSRAKYGKGRFVPLKWVFGGYDLTTK